MGTISAMLQAVIVLICAVVVMFYMNLLPVVIRKANAVIHGKTGCVPIGSIGNVTMHYFSVRGKGEAIRLMLEATDIPYKEISFNKEKWQHFKVKGTESGLYSFGQVPAIETTSGLKMVQTLAILHHIGRSAGLDCDCEDLHLCDMLAQGAADVKSKLGGMLYAPQYTMADRKNYLTETMPLWLGYLEKLAPPLTKQERPFFASDRLTWVDFIIFDVLDANKDFALYDFGQDKSLNVDVLSLFPKLNNFYLHFAGNPKIARYLRSDRRKPYTVPKSPVDAPNARK